MSLGHMQVRLPALCLIGRSTDAGSGFRVHIPPLLMIMVLHIVYLSYILLDDLRYFS